jgi:hypothetical protein
MRRLGMEAKLVPPAERDQRAQDQDSAGSMIEAGSAPDLAPGISGEQILKVAGQIVSPLGGSIDVSVAQDRPAGDLALAAAGLIVHNGCLAEEKVAERPGEGLGRFDRGDMRRRERYEARAGNPIPKELA